MRRPKPVEQPIVPITEVEALRAELEVTRGLLIELREIVVQYHQGLMHSKETEHIRTLLANDTEMYRAIVARVVEHRRVARLRAEAEAKEAEAAETQDGTLDLEYSTYQATVVDAKSEPKP